VQSRAPAARAIRLDHLTPCSGKRSLASRNSGCIPRVRRFLGRSTQPSSIQKIILLFNKPELSPAITIVSQTNITVSNRSLFGTTVALLRVGFCCKFLSLSSVGFLSVWKIYFVGACWLTAIFEDLAKSGPVSVVSLGFSRSVVNVQSLGRRKQCTCAA
jgi:hypothetical protein